MSCDKSLEDIRSDIQNADRVGKEYDAKYDNYIN